MNRYAPNVLACVGALAGVVSSFPADAGLGNAVEFYNAALGHYFLTAYPEEAAALDAGTNVKGWERTGGQFTVFTDPGDAPLARWMGIIEPDLRYVFPNRGAFPGPDLAYMS